MDLPLRIRSQPGTETVISVDGAFGAPGLNLSHWPGNTTPEALRHDLSTGSALLFAKLYPAERRRYAAGCRAICNNHVDTDGVCAMFAVAHPTLALQHEEQLLRAAAAGDFFRPVDESSRRLDAIITDCLDDERSPWRAETRGLDDDARHEYDVRAIVERLPGLLAGDVSEFDALWKPVVADWKADCSDLDALRCEYLREFDLVVWTASRDQASSRTHERSTLFDPSRQALFSKADADRQLVVAPTERGTIYRFLISTLSWFDQRGRPCLPRPDLERLAQRLNEAEGSGTDAWHAHATQSPSPELWFGAPNLPAFPTHAGSHLRASQLDPEQVRALILDALHGAAQ